MLTNLDAFKQLGLTATRLQALIAHHEQSVKPRLELLWNYYRNPMRPPGDQSFADTGQRYGSQRFRLGQERGLPARLLGCAGRSWGQLTDDRDVGRKEIVIENDIAWRVHTMIEFMFGKPIVLASTHADASQRRLIDRVLQGVWEASGGIGLLQDMALLAHVYGHVDLVVRAQERETDRDAKSFDPSAPRGGEAEGDASADRASSEEEIIERAIRSVRVEVIEPTRGFAVESPDDYRAMDAYVIRYERRRSGEPVRPISKRATLAASGLLRWLTRVGDQRAEPAPTDPGLHAMATEIISADRREVYLERSGRRELVAQGPALASSNRAMALGPPVVHIQNLSVPFAYEGLSEVEALIPLQDELNTRLSDRASRVTMQSFKMYLAKGLEGDRVGIAPGTVVSTENTEAKIESFGGDAESPSEDRHIEEIREALDKASSVPPLAAGVVRAKIGNLSSENALRVTLLGLLSKTNRKRVTYGRGIVRVCELILEALDSLGVLRTTEAERGVRVEWPEPLPRDERQALDAALKKVQLGVPRDRVLAELGYTVRATEQSGVE